MMKKILIFLLVFVFSLSSCALANVDLSVLSNQELVDLAHQIIDELASRQMNPNQSAFLPAAKPVYPEMTGERVEMFRCAEDKYLNENGDWIFPFAIENTTETDLFIYSLTFLDNGDSRGDYRDAQNDPFLFEMMMGPDFSTTPLHPGDRMFWQDAHPGEYLTSRTYLFSFIGEDGKEYTAEYAYNLLMEVSPDSPQHAEVSDAGQDLLTLRHDAQYALEVSPGVCWVPVVTLGESRFSNGDIRNLVSESPQTKQAEMRTLYEALQLYQLGGFFSSDDNIRLMENGINWEHHKPGYFAVVTNNGCCATSANWLNYILRDDYEEVGFIAISQRDGSGHIFNYIFHEGFYYFIDLTHYRTDWIATAVESGNPNDYFSTDFVLGNLHRADSVEAYAAYIQQSFGDPPGLMFQYTAENCLAIDSLRDAEGVDIVYEDCPQLDFRVIFDDPSDQLDFSFLPPPTTRPEW